jgi:hypothetical protein
MTVNGLLDYNDFFLILNLMFVWGGGLDNQILMIFIKKKYNMYAD